MQRTSERLGEPPSLRRAWSGPVTAARHFPRVEAVPTLDPPKRSVTSVNGLEREMLSDVLFSPFSFSY